MEIKQDTALQEGIIGCMIAAANANGQSSPEDFECIISIIAGRELFLDADIVGLIKTQLAMRYILDDESFLTSSCEKITDEWRRPIFTMACHLIFDSYLSPKAIRFLHRLKQELLLKNVNEIVEVMQELHKNRHQLTFGNI